MVRLVDFGAFVEIFPGTDGLLHISEISENRIKDVRDELKEGDQILVKVLALEGNKIKLSRKADPEGTARETKGRRGKRINSRLLATIASARRSRRGQRSGSECGCGRHHSRCCTAAGRGSGSLSQRGRCARGHNSNSEGRRISFRRSSHGSLDTITAKKSGYLAASASINLESQGAAKLDLVLTPEKEPDFFDEPAFIATGVSDPGQAGGHGSDAISRSTEKLAKSTAELGARERDRGGMEENAGHPLEAIHAFQRAAELAPTEPNLFAWAADLLKHRAPEQASEVFTKGNRLFPKSTRMLLGLGAAYYALGSFDQAARRFFQAADLNPVDPNPYLFLGRVEDMNSTEQQGIADRLGRFAHLEPQNALANYCYYAECLWKRKAGCPNCGLGSAPA